MSNTIDSYSNDARKEYQWKIDGIDGLRSYSYNASNPAWNYSTEPNSSNVDSDGAYRFSDSSTGQPSARRGNLYNQTAATLGSSLKLTTNGQQAQDSICPSGWQLPLSGDGSDYSKPATERTNRSFTKLLRFYDNVSTWNRVVKTPLEYLPTGVYNYGYAASRTTEGNWWSGVAYDNVLGYAFNLYSTDSDTQYDGNRGHGFALREVASV